MGAGKRKSDDEREKKEKMIKSGCHFCKKLGFSRVEGDNVYGLGAKERNFLCALYRVSDQGFCELDEM